MIAPSERLGFLIALVIAVAVMALGVLGVVYLARRYKAQQGAARGLFIAGIIGLALLAAGGALTAFVITIVFLSNNR